jgi:hypothetical protein
VFIAIPPGVDEAHLSDDVRLRRDCFNAALIHVDVLEKMVGPCPNRRVDLLGWIRTRACGTVSRKVCADVIFLQGESP